MQGSSSATAARTARAPRAGSRIICANTSPRCRSSGTWRPSSPARISSTASSARSKSCKVLIAVIGPRWATVTDETASAGSTMPATTPSGDRHRSQAQRCAGDSGAGRGRDHARPRALPADLKRWRDATRSSSPTSAGTMTSRNSWRPCATSSACPTLAHAESRSQARPCPRRKWITWAVVTFVVLGVIGYLSEEQGGGGGGYDTPARPAEANDVAPQPIAAAAPPIEHASNSEQQVPMLAGLWHDNMGGRFEIAQQGNQLIIQGAGGRLCERLGNAAGPPRPGRLYPQRLSTAVELRGLGRRIKARREHPGPCDRRARLGDIAAPSLRQRRTS